MALVYKVTKITNKGQSPLSPLDFAFNVDYYNFTETNPPILTLALSVSKANSVEGGSLMDAIDAAFALLGANEVDWSK